MSGDRITFGGGPPGTFRIGDGPYHVFDDTIEEIVEAEVTARAVAREVKVLIDLEKLIRRLRDLVSLNMPSHGGPYQGTAAIKCMEAMTEAADTLEVMLPIIVRVFQEDRPHIGKGHGALLAWIRTGWRSK